MSKLRTIRKYSNRRLYDLQVKRYVTLDDIYDWVVDDTDIRVIDKDRQEDITCAVLFQVVAAHEHRLHPSMNVDFLRQAICSSAGRSTGVMSLFLDLSLKLFLSGQMQHWRAQRRVKIHQNGRAARDRKLSALVLGAG